MGERAGELVEGGLPAHELQFLHPLELTRTSDGGEIVGDHRLRLDADLAKAADELAVRADAAEGAEPLLAVASFQSFQAGAAEERQRSVAFDDCRLDLKADVLATGL